MTPQNILSIIHYFFTQWTWYIIFSQIAFGIKSLEYNKIFDPR